MSLPIHIAALDLSLARTGWASVRVMEDGIELDHGALPTTAVPPGSPDYYPLTLARIRRLIDRILEEIMVHDHGNEALYIAIEAASYGTSREKAAQADARAGLRWMVYNHLEPVADVVVLIPPASLKLYVTGKGRADKRAIIEAIRAAFPDRWITDDNEADAIGLAAMVARKMGYPIDAFEQPWHSTALRGMTWPDALPTRYETSAYELDGLGIDRG